MKSTPGISVIVPCFNGEPYLRLALESIQVQTYPADEIILVDDGSTDQSVNLAKAFMPCITIIQQNHRGPAAARNAGIRAATGDWVAFLDADDLWAANKLELQGKVFLEHQQANAVLGTWQNFISEDLQLEDSAKLQFPAEETAAPTLGTLLIKREALISVGLFDESLIAGEFMDWWSRALAWGLQVQHLPELLMHRRVHGKNHSLSVEVRNKSYLDAIRKHRQRSTPPK